MVVVDDAVERDGEVAAVRAADGEVADGEVAAVRAAYAAFARGDVDAAVEALADDVVWTEPPEFPNGGRHVGRAAVRDYLRKSRAMWAVLESSVQVDRVGADVVALHTVRGRLVDGPTHENTVADVFTFRDGKVVEMTAYADPAQALARRRH